MGDEQDGAESVDEEMVGAEAVTSDEVGAFADAPDRPVGLPFADADVTDESFAERGARGTPEHEDDPNQLCGWWNQMSSSTATYSSGSTKTATSPNQTDPPVDRCGQIGGSHRGHALFAKKSGPLGGHGLASPKVCEAVHEPDAYWHDDQLRSGHIPGVGAITHSGMCRALAAGWRPSGEQFGIVGELGGVFEGSPAARSASPADDERGDLDDLAFTRAVARV